MEKCCSRKITFLIFTAIARIGGMFYILNPGAFWFICVIDSTLHSFKNNLKIYKKTHMHVIYQLSF